MEFAEKNRILGSAESATQGPYSAAPTPYVREWHKALDAHTVSQVTIIAPAQTGKTTFLQNVLFSKIALNPQPSMFLFPTLELAKIFSRGRLREVLKNKILRGLVSKKNHATVNMCQVQFRGGSLILCGSNNVSALSSHPISTLYADEIDRLTSDTTEGQPLELAKARTRSFFNRKILLTSTPTATKTSQIFREFEQGTKERFCYPCPHCGAWTEPAWERLAEYHFDPHSKTVTDTDLFMGCGGCGGLISEKDFRALLMSGAFRWIAEAPEVQDHRSFWLSGFVSPFVPWAEIIKKYEESKDDATKFKVFKNTVLAELWDGLEIDKEKQGSLMGAREFWGAGVDVPPGVSHLVAGVDTQDAYLRYVVFGWGKEAGLCCLESGKIDGIPSDKATFDAFRAFLGRTWKTAENKLLPLNLCLVDSQGHFSGTWYRYSWELRRQAHPRVLIIKGASKDDAPAIKMPPTSVQVDNRSNHKTELYFVGVSSLKSRLYQLIDSDAIRFTANGAAGIDQSFFDELLSEIPVFQKGKLRWAKIHRRNEALDCSVYSLAALELLGITPKAEAPKPKPANIDTEPEPEPPQTAPASPTPKRIRKKTGTDWDGGSGWGWGW